MRLELLHQLQLVFVFRFALRLRDPTAAAPWTLVRLGGGATCRWATLLRERVGSILWGDRLMMLDQLVKNSSALNDQM